MDVKCPIKFMRGRKPCIWAAVLAIASLSAGLTGAIGISELLLWMSEIYNA